MLEQLQKLKGWIGIFVTCVTVGVVGTFFVQTWAADAKEANEKVGKLEKIMARQQTLMELQADKVEMMFQLYVNLDRDSIERVRSLPRTMPVDATGNPVIGSEWLSVSEYDSVVIHDNDTLHFGFPRIGQVVEMADTGVVVLRTLWDLRGK
jgi:hypothetical protein